MSNLLLHCGATRVSRDELAFVPTPKATSSWKPVPHRQVAELVCEETAKRGYEVVSEEYGLNPAGTRMFAVLRFHPEGHPEYSRCIGFRNSHDKSMALGITAGLTIIVCDNLCFGGETTIHRRHTSGIEVEGLIPNAFDNLSYQFQRLEDNVAEMKLRPISITGAKLLTVQAAEEKVIASCDILPVLNEFREPRHEEFRPQNLWSLYNSFTELAKKYSPARSDQCYRGLAKLFALA
tara:strand:- start:1049 stop:1756 length:708 start_codon:yes stop_codon:yes gene_type:complete